MCLVNLVVGGIQKIVGKTSGRMAIENKERSFSYQAPYWSD
jgi:hypothetical protein